MVLGWISNVIIHRIFSLARDWSKRVRWANIPQLKLEDIPQFLKPMDNKHNSLNLAAKICSRKTFRFSEQIMSADKYPSISSRQMKAIVYLGVRLDNMVYTTSFPGLFFQPR